MRRPPTDADWMAAAVALAWRGRGRSAPNPNVGCVVIADGGVVGRGWTQPGGRPHAEAVALAAAGSAAHGATAYVTLETCAHASPARKSVGQGESVSVRVELGCIRFLKIKNKT